MMLDVICGLRDFSSHHHLTFHVHVLCSVSSLGGLHRQLDSTALHCTALLVACRSVFMPPMMYLLYSTSRIFTMYLTATPV